MSLLTKAVSSSTSRSMIRSAPRALSTLKGSDGADFDLSAELLRGLAALNPQCPIATQKIENITTEEVMQAVKARDYHAIANLQWSAEIDYLKKMSARGISTDAKSNQTRSFSSAKDTGKDVPFTASFLRQLSTPKNNQAVPRNNAKNGALKRNPKTTPTCWSVDGEIYIP